MFLAIVMIAFGMSACDGLWQGTESATAPEEPQMFNNDQLSVEPVDIKDQEITEANDFQEGEVSEGPYDEDATVIPDSISLISQEVAYQVVLSSGINSDEIRFFDVVPYDQAGNGDFEIAWGAISIDIDKEELRGTFIDALNGELLATNVPLHEGLESRLVELGIENGNMLTGVNQYESYPWGYDLPTSFGNRRLTCGYGCGYHRGANYYAVDFALGHGECLPAPGSGWCMMAGDRGDGYGKQVIILGGPANNNNRYVYRMAHCSATYIVPGWWIDKNRTVGAAGCTGNCTGTHVHFSIHRGYYSGGRIYGGSVPLDRWPGPNDRVDYFNRYATWQFSFNVCR